MFSGIVEAVGMIKSVESRQGGVRFTIETPELARDLKPSESVSVCGACLTVVSATDSCFAVDVVPETIARTSFGRLKSGEMVNLERPVRLTDRLGGHLVSGHVDGVGIVTGRVPEGEGARISISPPEELERYLVFKGSVCVEGVSLTVAAVKPGSFDVAIIPFTLQHTTFSGLVVGARVNLEADLIAKYVERLLREGWQGQPKWHI